MPLAVDGVLLTSLPHTLEELWKKFPHLVEHAHEFRKRSPVDVGPKGLLYVNQREYAVTTPSNPRINILGSDDATTCHIAVLRHTGSGVTGLAHCDGCGMEVGLRNMAASIIQQSLGSPDGRLELHLVGGFIDSKQESTKLCRKLLSLFMNLDHVIHLETACTCDNNDELHGSIHFPVITGLGVEVKTGEIYPASFHDKGPVLNVRSAIHFVGYKKMCDIYDNSTGHLVVGPYSWDSWDDIDMWLAMPDAFLRKNLSTSPEQEPPHFESCVRASLRVIKDHPFPKESLFPNRKPWRFMKQSGGGWTRSDTSF